MGEILDELTVLEHVYEEWRSWKYVSRELRHRSYSFGKSVMNTFYNLSTLISKGVPFYSFVFVFLFNFVAPRMRLYTFIVYSKLTIWQWLDICVHVLAYLNLSMYTSI